MLLALQKCSPPVSSAGQKATTEVVTDPLKEVLVTIGDSSGVFDIDGLRQLDYFKTLFSERWMTRAKEEKKSVVDVLGTNSSQKASFGCQDLALLLDTYDHTHIPFDAVLTCDQIDSYCYCLEFFTPNHKANMVKDLVEYFEHRMPSIDSETRQMWLLNAKHPMFRAACLSYDKKLSQQKALLEHDIMEGNSRQNTEKISGSLFKYDAHTAALLLRKKFRISFETTATGKKLTITNFNQAEWDKLCKSFNFIDYWHYFGEDISYIIDNLKSCDENTRIEMSKEEHQAVASILYQVADQMIGGLGTYWESPNIPFNIGALPIIKSFFNLTHKSTVYKKFAQSVLNDLWPRWLQKLSASDTQHLLESVLSLNKLYTVEDTTIQNEREADKGKNAKCEIAWWDLMKKLLSRCSGAFLVHHGKNWFPAMHRSKALDTKSSVEWVMQTVVPKLNTQLSFNFGLYLAHYAVFEHKNRDQRPNQESDFPKQYLEFMRKEAGIAWDVSSAHTSHPESSIEPL